MLDRGVRFHLVHRRFIESCLELGFCLLRGLSQVEYLFHRILANGFDLLLLRLIQISDASRPSRPADLPTHGHLRTEQPWQERGGKNPLEHENDY